MSTDILSEINEAISTGNIDLYDDDSLIVSAVCLDKEADAGFLVGIFEYNGHVFTVTFDDEWPYSDPVEPPRLITEKEKEILKGTRDKINHMLG